MSYPFSRPTECLGNIKKEERKRDVDPPGEVDLTVPSAEERKGFTKKKTTPGLPASSPTVVLARSDAA